MLQGQSKDRIGNLAPPEASSFLVEELGRGLGLARVGFADEGIDFLREQLFQLFGGLVYRVGSHGIGDVLRTHEEAEGPQTERARYALKLLRRGELSSHLDLADVTHRYARPFGQLSLGNTEEYPVSFHVANQKLVELGHKHMVEIQDGKAIR